MIVKHVAAAILAQAAQDVHVNLTIDNRSTSHTLAYSVKLTPMPTPDQPHHNYWQRVSASPFHRGRRVHAVCFHGYTAYMRRLFELAPQVRVETKVPFGPLQRIKFETLAQLDALADDIGDLDIGPPISPIAYRDACSCANAGR